MLKVPLAPPARAPTESGSRHLHWSTGRQDVPKCQERVGLSLRLARSAPPCDGVQLGRSGVSRAVQALRQSLEASRLVGGDCALQGAWSADEHA